MNRRAAFLARWYYTRHLLDELGPIAACIFVLTGLIAAASFVWYWVFFGWWL